MKMTSNEKYLNTWEFVMAYRELFGMLVVAFVAIFYALYRFLLKRMQIDIDNKIQQQHEQAIRQLRGQIIQERKKTNIHTSEIKLIQKEVRVLNMQYRSIDAKIEAMKNIGDERHNTLLAQIKDLHADLKTMNNYLLEQKEKL